RPRRGRGPRRTAGSRTATATAPDPRGSGRHAGHHPGRRPRHPRHPPTRLTRLTRASIGRPATATPLSIMATRPTLTHQRSTPTSAVGARAAGPATPRPASARLREPPDGERARYARLAGCLASRGDRARPPRRTPAARHPTP